MDSVSDVKRDFFGFRSPQQDMLFTYVCACVSFEGLPRPRNISASIL